MLILGIISETLLYLCFSVLFGSFIIYLVPRSHRPDMNVPKGLLMFAAGGIAILSFTPLLQLVLYLYQDIGLMQTLRSVIYTFEVGKAWIFTYLVSNFLLIFIIWFDYKSKSLYAYIGIGVTLLLTLSLGWASHASSIEQWKGFLTHSTHFLAVTIWIGLLIVVSWYSKNHSNWLNFLKWFSPVAIGCFLITIVTGLFLMSFVLEFKDYGNSWLLPYGQALLFKHLLIIPLIVYAFINGTLIKKRLNENSDFNPKPWAKVESIVILFIFSVTAALGQQSPPHETVISSSVISKLFTMFYQGQIVSEMAVQFTVNINGLLLMMLAVLLLLLIIFSYVKKVSPVLSFFLSILFVFASYLSLIVSIQ